MIHYGLLPIIDHITAIKRGQAELENKLSEAKADPSLCTPESKYKLDKKVEQVCKTVRNLRGIYDVSLYSTALMLKIARFFKLHIALVLEWGQYNPTVPKMSYLL